MATTTRFRCFCPRCGRGPFVVTKAGNLRKHACWTRLSAAEIYGAREQAGREEMGREACRQVIAARARVNRIEVIKVFATLAILLVTLLGSCR